jgi:hypothetical protein
MNGQDAAPDPAAPGPRDRLVLGLLAGDHSFEEIAEHLGHGDAAAVRRDVHRLLGAPEQTPPGAAPADARRVDQAIERSSLGRGVAPDLRRHAPEATVAAAVAHTRRRTYAQRADGCSSNSRPGTGLQRSRSARRRPRRPEATTRLRAGRTRRRGRGTSSLSRPSTTTR